MNNNPQFNFLNSELIKLHQIVEALEDLILSRSDYEKAQACKDAQKRLIDESESVKLQLGKLDPETLKIGYPIANKTLLDLAMNVGKTWQEVIASVAVENQTLIASWRTMLDLCQKTSEKLKQLKPD
jgi:hypothetical protein